MPYQPKSYLSGLVILLGMIIMATGARAQTIYLDPAVEYVTTGVGTEFDLELKVDAGFTSMRSFIYYVDFDASMLDTVSVTEGPLLSSEGDDTYFFKYIVGDTSLQLQGMLLGAGNDVAGPGTLATVRIRVLDTGYVNMQVEKYRIRDVTADTVICSAEGAEIYIDIPPEEFNLISPIEGTTVSRLPGETFDFTWNSTTSLYPGDDIEYTLVYARDPGFTLGVETISGLTDTVFTASANDFINATYYWYITASSSLHGFERRSTPIYESFDFEFEVTEPTAFDLIWPSDAESVDLYGHSQIAFDWETSTSNVPGDTISYVFYLGPDPGVPTGALLVDTVWHLSEINIDSALIPRGEWQYWTVNAYNGYGLDTWAATSRSAIYYNNCDMDHNGELDITDLQLLIDYQFLTLTAPFPLETANCDCLGDVDISDVQRLIDNQFLSLAPLPVCD